MADPLFASAHGSVLRVALPVPIDTLFDYWPPEGDATIDDWVGRRVLVPFSGRKLVGVVVETADLPERADRTLHAHATLDEAPVVGEHLLGALREAAPRALCPARTRARAGAPARLGTARGA